jgi:tryptophan synthase alpha chain
MTSSNKSLEEQFALCLSEGRAALIPYVTAGFPHPERTLDILLRVADAGADIIELGIPFSDPLADGPTIQKASFKALEEGMSVGLCLQVLRDFRTLREVPIVLFSYLNPILHYGLEHFLNEATDAGAQGLLLTDLPVGADSRMEEIIRSSALDPIHLLAPTTAPERVPQITRGGRGFLYYISRTGVTGAREQLRDDLALEVSELRERVELPIAVGFGISTPEQAAAVAAVADGVVVGSALIQAIERGGEEAAAEFTAALRSAMAG